MVPFKGHPAKRQTHAGKVNVLADALSRSRGVVQTEWTLNRDVLQAVWDAWDLKPMVDLFATKFSKRLPVYVSPVPDPEAWGVDALSLDWNGLIAYAFPPFPILSKVVRKARIERPQLILVAPFWPAQTWFPDLQELSHVPPGSPGQEGPAPTAAVGVGAPQPPSVLPAHVAAVRAHLCPPGLTGPAPRSAAIQAALSAKGASRDLKALVAEARYGEPLRFPLA